MRKWTLTLSVALAFLLLACKEKEKLCEQENKPCKTNTGEALCEEAEKRCEVGKGKCVVGYDGDCWTRGQVCYAGDGAPKGKPGTCTDGQFDANGKLRATLVYKGVKQGERWVGVDTAPGPYGPCFFPCPVIEPALSAPSWLGKAPATLAVTIQGPNAEAEQLKVSVRGLETGHCKRSGSTPGRQEWECEFPEGWAGVNTTEPLELKMWIESAQEFPKTKKLGVDTQAMALELDTYRGEGVLTVNVRKAGAPKDAWKLDRAWFAEVRYSTVEVFKNDLQIPFALESNMSLPLTLSYSPSSPEQWGPLPSEITLYADFESSDTLEVRTTVSAKDMADNEFPNSHFPSAELEARL